MTGASGFAGPGSIRCAHRAPQIPKPGCRVSALRVTIPRARDNVPLAGGGRSRVPPSASLCSRSCGRPFNRSRGWRMVSASLPPIRTSVLFRPRAPSYSDFCFETPSKVHGVSPGVPLLLVCLPELIPDCDARSRPCGYH